MPINQHCIFFGFWIISDICKIVFLKHLRINEIAFSKIVMRFPCFVDKLDEFIRECGIQNNWTDSTYEKFAATKKHLQDFDKELTFEALNESKLTEYVNYLRDTKNLRNSTIGKQIGFLK